MATRVDTNKLEEAKGVIGPSLVSTRLFQPEQGNGTKRIQTRIGQNQEQASPIISTKATEQPLVKVGGVMLRGKSTLRRETIGGDVREKFRVSAPGPEEVTLPTKEILARRKEGLPEKRVGGLRRVEPPVPTVAEAVPTDITPRGIKPTAPVQKKDFNILNFEGIENIFSSAGELAAHFASPEFQTQQRKARVASATQRGRLTELKSIDSSIKALSSALPGAALSGDVELETTLSTQLSEMVKRRGEVSSGAGTSRRGADPSTVEGFASLLKELGLTNDEIKIAANRRFAGGG